MLKLVISWLNQHRTLRYLLSGGITYATEVGSFFVLYFALHIFSGAANAISYTLAMVVNYCLAHFFVFGDYETILKRSLSRYLIFAGFNLLCSSLIVQLLVSGLGFKALIVKPLLSIAVAIWSYFGFKKFVFN
jgi:putative flippase GtrA